MKKFAREPESTSTLRKPIKSALRLGSIALALIAMQSPAMAVDYIWQGGGGFWDDASKWTLLGVPGSGDSATLPKNTGTASLLVRDPRAVGQLYLNGGNLASSSTLTVSDLHFGSGYFGRSEAQSGGVMNVTGSATFNGEYVQTIAYSHIVNLGANTNWTKGDGRLSVEQAYMQGMQNYASAVLNIGAGTSFADAGAASDTGYKVLGGGAVNNYGTYVRTGQGETVARGFNNLGTLTVASGAFSFDGGNFKNSSSGQIQVASGATLNLANTVFTQGAVLNNGLVRQFGGDVVVGAAAQIGGAWQVDQGSLKIQGTHAVDSLVFNGYELTGQGVLNTGSLVFNYGNFGGQQASGGTTLNVAGSATFNGAGELNLRENHTLNLAGNSRWTVGNGRLTVAGSSTQGTVVSPAGVLNIGAGTTFTDEGANSAASYKTLGGQGNTVNNGTYVRRGLGETYAQGFQNKGELQILAGSMSVDGQFANTGQVSIQTGAQLLSYNSQFSSAGLLSGTGRIKTFNNNIALTNSGSINPGQGTDIGSLTIEGDLSMTDTAVLHIDLAGGGMSDQLVITDDALWNGELSVWARPGTELHLGDVYTIASFGKRQANSTFSSISWHGLGADQFAVEYTSNNITLRVTAVPEPETWALLLAGLGAVGFAARRKASR